MRKRLVMGLLCMGFVAVLVVLPGAANAGVCTKPPCAGVKWFGGSCICCSTGSEIFNFTAWGVPGSLVKDCPAGKNCLKCSVYGTYPPETCATALDPFCGVEGVLFCLNHGNNAAKAQGQPFTLEGVQSASGDFTNCDRQGKCTGQIQVFGELPVDGCINPNWQPVAFTASKFNAECCFCDTGYDEITGECSGTETCTEEGFRCSVATVPKPGNSQPYQCCPLSALDPLTGECSQQ